MDAKVISTDKGILKLCCAVHGCPSVDFTDPSAVVLKDDFGGVVRLSKDEWELLKSHITAEANIS